MIKELGYYTDITEELRSGSWTLTSDSALSG